MTTSVDYTPQEWDLLQALPYVVAGTSLALIPAGPLKTIKAALSIYPSVRDTSQNFPENDLIQSAFAARGAGPHNDHEKLVEEHTGSGRETAIAVRNEMCEKALVVLREKSQRRESEEYRRWLLQIAEMMLHEISPMGFLSFGKNKAKEEVATALRDLAAVLQLEA